MRSECNARNSDHELHSGTWCIKHVSVPFFIAEGVPIEKEARLAEGALLCIKRGKTDDRAKNFCLAGACG